MCGHPCTHLNIRRLDFLGPVSSVRLYNMYKIAHFRVPYVNKYRPNPSCFPSVVIVVINFSLYYHKPDKKCYRSCLPDRHRKFKSRVSCKGFAFSERKRNSLIFSTGEIVQIKYEFLLKHKNPPGASKRKASAVICKHVFQQLFRINRSIY